MDYQLIVKSQSLLIEKEGLENFHMKEKRFNYEKAKQIGDALGINWIKFGVEQFWMGLEVELEHGARDPETNVTNDDPLLTGKIALAHLKEFPDYYTRLLKMETEGRRILGQRIGLHGKIQDWGSYPPVRKIM